MYNVLKKIRAGEELSEKDRAVHEQGLISVLDQLHRELDRAVLDAYEWNHDLSEEQIVEKIVVLNSQRAAEERQGAVHWLRPELQNPTGVAATAVQIAIAESVCDQDEAPATILHVAPWPKSVPEQLSAIRALIVKERGGW
jgi:hypothetical protein